MALIHEKLYRSEDLAHVPFSVYLESLIDSLKDAYGISNGSVTIAVSIDPPDLSLNIETGIPCGLIINELISNALKHAFKGGRQGVIAVAMRQTGPKTFTLSIADNGPGFPTDVDFKNTTSLGLQLVNNLVSQLDGEIALDSTNGTAFSMRLKTIEDYSKK
jgi:two-component sensor histidine kinase